MSATAVRARPRAEEVAAAPGVAPREPIGWRVPITAGLLLLIGAALFRYGSRLGVEVSLLDLKFLALLAVVVGARVLCPVRYYAEFGVVASAVLVGLGSVATLVAIAGITLLYLYPVHLLYRSLKRRAPALAASRWLLAASVAGLVALLLVSKLHRHFAVPFLGGPWVKSELLALVGFSYFVFRAIGFLHIQAILDIRERTPWGLLYFMLFPPTITSGPIQKYQDFRQQLASPLPLNARTGAEAVYRITRGYFRKVVLAYLLDLAVKRLLATGAPNAYVSIATITCLYLYFYFDFAGYSDVAIGLGALLGMRVPENFRSPFRATSVTEFWRNWHITLADWFRDNVFIPLGGMKSGRRKAAFLGLLIMVLCGMWHGLTLSFLAWGVWHGTLLFVEGVGGSRPMPPSQRHGIRYWGRVLRTNALVALGAVFFLPSATSIRFLLAGLLKWL